MRLVSLMYFVTFAITVPLASYMIVYGVYTLRAYVHDKAAAAGGGAASSRKAAPPPPRRPGAELYDHVHSMMRQKASRTSSFSASLLSRSATKAADSSPPIRVPAGNSALQPTACSKEFFGVHDFKSSCMM